MRYVLLRTCLEQYVTSRFYRGHFLMEGKPRPCKAARDPAETSRELRGELCRRALAVMSFAGMIKRFYNFRDQL